MGRVDADFDDPSRPPVGAAAQPGAFAPYPAVEPHVNNQVMAGNASRLWHGLIDHYRTPRVLGLDLLRITASLSVIVYHGNAAVFLGRNLVFRVVANDGYLAVDIFFVLSGWLLTRQILRMRSRFPSGPRLAWRFWTRRWARTLPPYLVVMGALFVFGNALVPHLHRDVLISTMTLPQFLVHVAFLQTLLPPNALGVTWSLVTEEWFYLLLPLIVLLVVPHLRSWQGIVGLGGAALLLAIVIRAIMFATPGGAASLIYTPQARFDGLVIGSLLAGASLAAPWWESHVMAHRRMLFATGIALMIPVLLAGVSHGWAYTVIGLLLFNVAIGLLMPLLSRLQWPQRAPILAVIAVTFLSELTYPLYLLHLFRPAFHATSSIKMMVLFAVLLVAAATLLHLGVERPCLALRDRWDRERARRQEGAVVWKEPTAGSPAPTPATVPTPTPQAALA